MRSNGSNGKTYTKSQIVKLINDTAENELNMTGEEAIRAIRTREWKSMNGNADTWLWLNSLCFLLPDDPRRIKANASV